jgi:hypothetical protein
MPSVYENVHIANSNILSRNGIISQRFIKSDGRHLSEEGVKVLASNLRLVVEGILGLTNTKNNNVHKREGYQYNRRSDTDNSYYDEHRYYHCVIIYCCWQCVHFLHCGNAPESLH